MVEALVGDGCEASGGLVKRRVTPVCSRARGLHGSYWQDRQALTAHRGVNDFSGGQGLPSQADDRTDHPSPHLQLCFNFFRLQSATFLVTADD